MLIEIQKLTNLDSVSEGGSGAGAAQKKVRLRKKKEIKKIRIWITKSMAESEEIKYKIISACIPNIEKIHFCS